MTPPDRRRPPLPWALLLMFASVGTLLGTGLALLDLHRTGETNGGLVHTRPGSPASPLLAADLPDEPQSIRGDHDGQQFYAIARDPFDLDVVVRSLDRPRYRLQHPLFSWLSWIVHPGGRGPTLVWTMFAVNVLGVLIGSLAMGALSCTLRGPPVLAVVFGVLPGVVIRSDITTADSLAVALMLVVLVLFLRGHDVAAGCVAVAAVLTKEPMLIAFVGLALWSRRRRGLLIVVPPVVVAGLWFLYLHARVVAGGDQVVEFGLPLDGLVASVRLWATGSDSYAMASMVLAVVLSGVALAKRRLRHPLGLALLLELGFLLVLKLDVIGLERNGTRMTLPVMVLAIVMIATPRGAEQPSGPRQAGDHRRHGIDGVAAEADV
jgi:hypothetical protein